MKKLERIATQEEVRERLLRLINDGFIAKFIADKTSIAESSFSKFRHNKLDLTVRELNNLNAFLTSKGY